MRIPLGFSLVYLYADGAKAIYVPLEMPPTSMPLEEVAKRVLVPALVELRNQLDTVNALEQSRA